MSKAKKWIFGIIFSNLPWIMVALFVCAGISAVASFFQNLFNWGEKNNIDINTCTIEQLIEAVDDKSAFPDSVLDQMMIDRKSLKLLLKTVNDYNNRREEKAISVETKKVYTVFEKVVKEEDSDIGTTEGSTTENSTTENNTADDNKESTVTPGSRQDDNKKNKQQDIIKESDAGRVSESGDDAASDVIAVTYTEYFYKDYIVNNNYILDMFDIDWQTVYIFCIFKSMSNYQNWIPGGEIYDASGNKIVVEPMKLTEEDVLAVIEDVKPEYTFKYDAVMNSKSVYSWAEVETLFHTPMSYVDHNADGITYYYSANVPISEFIRVDGLAYTVIFTNKFNIDFDLSYYSAAERFLGVAQYYNSKLTVKAFLDLLEILPGGKAVSGKYIESFNLSPCPVPRSYLQGTIRK